jgi:hypothetical protein
MTQREIAEGLRQARSMSREDVLAKMDSLLDDMDREVLAKIDVPRWLTDDVYRSSTWLELPASLQTLFGTFGVSMFLGAAAVKGEK